MSLRTLTGDIRYGRFVLDGGEGGGGGGRAVSLFLKEISQRDNKLYIAELSSFSIFV